MDNAAVPAYWLLSDDRLELSSDWGQAGMFKSHFKHSVLYNTQLVIPDSYAVNNYNFRRLLREDEDIRRLVADQVLRVACRADADGGPRSLIRIRDEMLPDKKPREFTDEEYRSDEELAFLMEHAPLETYTLEAVAERYSTKAIEVFESVRAEQKLGDAKVAAAVARLAQEAKSKSVDGAGEPPRVGFGRAFFYYELEKLFPAATGLRWEEFRKPVLALANAPYLTALPSVLDLEPVYAPQHQEAFEIVRGGRGKPEPLDEFAFSTKLGLHSFAKGIELLSIDDLHWLHETDEAKHVRRLLGPDETSVDIKRIATAMQAYQERIEDRIILRFQGMAAESADGNGKRVWAAVDSAADVTSDVLAYVSLGLSSVGLNILGVMLTRPIRFVVKRAAGVHKREQATQEAAKGEKAMKQAVREQLIDSLLAGGREDRLDAKGYWGREGKETLYQAAH